ncbi:hypothetical protein OWR29_39080 [Actinoplanes sp. Pm04-4]|uniref:Uncharacterized protein n=1 Tax=Paractinoplanes pyxinae TaxID=2997416 RepID=A0ABT4BBZ1_9ACTN|nr:hypothetical protein [Actinoplanes pyxinae]MCY1144035.1 hypothetical protein [Actinoplanes pyxinae]
MTSSSISGSLQAFDLVDVATDSDVLRRRVSITLDVQGRHDEVTLRRRIDRAFTEVLPSKIAPWLGRIESGPAVKWVWDEEKRRNEVGRPIRSKCTLRAEL